MNNRKLLTAVIILGLFSIAVVYFNDARVSPQKTGEGIKKQNQENRDKEGWWNGLPFSKELHNLTK